MRKYLAGCLYVFMFVGSSAAMAATPDNFKTAVDRDDYEMALFNDNADPAGLCAYGTHNRRYPDPASACRAAYSAAMKAKTFNAAARYAALGCEAYRDKGLCLAMPKIPFSPTGARATPVVSR
jgi:hypothetical protein